MAYRWLLLIILLTTACGKPISKVPLKEIHRPHYQEHKDSVDKPIIAPIPLYGNKICLCLDLDTPSSKFCLDDSGLKLSRLQHF
jgi:hypothetical protein